jgi:septal ring factor EnvC (AmiA/AmiB activator)
MKNTGASNKSGYVTASTPWMAALLCLFIFSAGHTYSQTTSQAQANAKKKEQLQQQMKDLQAEIKEIESIIKSTSEKKKQSLSQLQALQAKIKSRQKLIANINGLVSELDNDIKETENVITAESTKVDVMKEQYALMLRKTYHNLSIQNELLFLLSANSFNEAMTRYRYLKKAADFRRIQAKQIQEAIGQLQVKKTILEENKDQKLTLLNTEKSEQQNLLEEKKEQDQMITKLSDQEKLLRKRFAAKNKAIQAMNRKIQYIIEEEIRIARRKAEEAQRQAQAAGRKPATGTTPPATTARPRSDEPIALAPEEQALSNDFANNRTRLPWPVTRGLMIGSFGRQEHPTLKGVFIENNGVDIKTTDGSEARAVFGGTVVSIFSLPTTQTCIIVKHGEYFTVYSNIDQASVRMGDKITTKQPIGKLHTDSEEGLTKVHLEIWRGKEKLNPQLWLSAR